MARAIAEYRVAFILSLIAFNFTEATFKAVHPSFFLFFLSSVDYAPMLKPATVPAAAVEEPSAPTQAVVRPAYSHLVTPVRRPPAPPVAARSR